ncbi:MAG: polysaccharide deacetylase family protein [Clostridia bacterium]|nr:polysaccharide deacetylase family protein [Clostridia bacterium]
MVIIMQSFIAALIAFFSMLTPFIKTDKTEQRQFQLPVIMYHHISENTSLLNDYVITPQEFENDIKYLSDNGYSSISAFQLVNGDIPEKSVMITFDDGFLSTYKFALPVLKKYNMTAVCAVIGSLTQEFTLHPDFVSDCAYMDTDTVRKLTASGVFEIACHTFDMHSLGIRKGCAETADETDDEYRKVLTDDLARFGNFYEQIFDASTDIIAFPYGEYSQKTVDIAHDIGYTVMLTCDEKVNLITTGSDYYVLGRFNRPHGKPSAEFLGNILHQ